MTSPSTDYILHQVSEELMLLHFGDLKPDATTRAIRQIDYAIRQQPFPGFVETVPAYNSLGIYFDPLRLYRETSLKNTCSKEYLSDYLQQLKPGLQHLPQSMELLIPVCYDDAYAPDMEEVMFKSGLNKETIITLHCDAVYEVMMIGFMPGFPYLSGLDPRLSMPRKLSPRQKVPAGSVAIAGLQSGIYPFDSPGGWQVIGRTPMQMFNLHQEPPALLEAGAIVRFARITTEEFLSLTA